MAREMANQSGNTDVLVHHGATDAPAVDVVEVGVGAGTIVNNLEYTDFAGYLELPTADYTLEIRDSTGSSTVETYSAPLSTLGLTDEALVVVASGFLDPSNNNNGEPFGLYVALAAGGDLVQLPVATIGLNEANIQSFSVYPNPANDYISLSGLSNPWDYELYTISGQLVKQGVVKENERIDLQSLDLGTYILKLNHQGKSELYRIVK